MVSPSQSSTEYYMICCFIIMFIFVMLLSLYPILFSSSWSPKNGQMYYLAPISVSTLLKVAFIFFQVRHPNILSFLHSTEVETLDGSSTKVTIYIVTEPVMPLSEKIKELGLEGSQR